MTTIVTTTSGKYATMAADQGITTELITPDMPKIVKQGTWLIAVCGDDRPCDVLQYGVTYPRVPATLKAKPMQDWYAFVVRNVIPRIHEAISHTQHKDDHGTLGDAEAFLVTHGRAFYIADTMSVTKAAPYWSIGSGAHLALGHLVTAQYEPKWEVNHDRAALEAIEVAQMHDPYTRGVIDVWRSEPSGRAYQVFG